MNEQIKVKLQPNLIPFRVSLHEEAGDKFTIHFECMAENEDHAIEQAENAYPGCEIRNWIPTVEEGLYRIYAKSEAEASDGGGFWSNEDGWVGEESATLFNSFERETLDFMPMSAEQDAEWQTVPTANVRAEIQVMYILNQETPQSLKRRLKSELIAAIDRGLLSGDTTAEVERHAVKVHLIEQSNVDLDEPDHDDIAAFITKRIEDGDLDLEDIPRLMASYGLIDPKQFIAEMKERIELSKQD